MEIELIIREKKEMYSSLMEFIDSSENEDIELLFKEFKKRDYLKNKEESLSTLHLISKIADNPRNRTSNK